MADERVHFESKTGGIAFDDTRDHFENAVLRLAVDRATFQPWLDAAGACRGPLEQRLREGFSQVKPEWAVAPPPVEVGPARLLHPRLAENPAFGVAVAGDEGFLVGERSGRWQVVTEPPAYEEAYFEGGSATGYGRYLEQAPWRLEKAARQVRELAAATGLRGGRVLDVGSGYGFFRKGLADAGFAQEGVEISAHAREVARALYGFTSAKALDEVRGPFDAITLWDVIEHVAEPTAFFAGLWPLLAPGGFVAVKTPNLVCPEADVFQAAYHSFKREHLRYFTPGSLERAARGAGLQAVQVGTVSHLLVGFFGAAELRQWEQRGRGADIIAYFRRPPA